MVLNLTQIKETTEEVLILTPITLHQSRALLRLPQNIPKSLQITKNCFRTWVNMGQYELVLGVTGSVILSQGNTGWYLMVPIASAWKYIFDDNE